MEIVTAGKFITGGIRGNPGRVPAKTIGEIVARANLANDSLSGIVKGNYLGLAGGQRIGHYAGL